MYKPASTGNSVVELDCVINLLLAILEMKSIRLRPMSEKTEGKHKT